MHLFNLLRPKQWIKNAFVVAPLIFSKKFTNTESIEAVSIVFLLFCLGASAVYILNDLKDIEKDRLHPVKSKIRPLASGAVSPKVAKVTLVGLYALIGIFYTYFPNITLIVIIYVTLNVAYTFYLKHQPILDIFTISAGFVLRVYAGVIALNLTLSPWMFITTLTLALYLASAKRHQELLNSGDLARGVLSQYSINLLEKFMQTSSIGSIVFYSLFVALTRPELIPTIPFVLFGLFRFQYIVDIQGNGESPTDALIRDKTLLGCILLWVIVSAYLLIQPL